MPKTYMDWPDPVQHEGIHVPLEYRPKKKKHHWHPREGSVLEGILFAACLAGIAAVMFIFLR